MAGVIDQSCHNSLHRDGVIRVAGVIDHSCHNAWLSCQRDPRGRSDRSPLPVPFYIVWERANVQERSMARAIDHSRHVHKCQAGVIDRSCRGFGAWWEWSIAPAWGSRVAEAWEQCASEHCVGTGECTVWCL